MAFGLDRSMQLSPLKSLYSTLLNTYILNANYEIDNNNFYCVFDYGNTSTCHQSCQKKMSYIIIIDKIMICITEISVVITFTKYCLNILILMSSNINILNFQFNIRKNVLQTYMRYHHDQVHKIIHS